MSDNSFAVFCVTAITLAAIARGNDKIAEKALAILNGTTKGIVSLVEKLVDLYHKSIESDDESEG